MESFSPFEQGNRINQVTLLYVYVDGPFAYSYVCAPWAYSVLGGQKIRSLGTGITNGCEPPDGCWELNPGPLQEQEVNKRS